MGKKHFCFFETAETGNRTPNSGVKGSGANHYPRAPALIVGNYKLISYDCIIMDQVIISTIIWQDITTCLHARDVEPMVF